MNIVQKRINKTAITAWTVSMIALLSGCIAENLEDCPQPFELTVQAVDISDKNITSNGDIEDVILFTFDKSGKHLDKILLNAEEVKARKPIHIEHYDPKSLTFVAWDNVAAADMARLESVQRIEGVQMSLQRTDGSGQHPTDLFSDQLNREQIYDKFELGKPAAVDIYRRTCQVNVTVLSYEQWLNRQGYKRQAFDLINHATAQILFGKSLDNYSTVDTYGSNPMIYRLTGSLDSSTGDCHIVPFRVYPPIESRPFQLNFYIGDNCLESFIKDPRGTLLLSEIGKMLSVLIDMRSGDISVQVVVTPWSVIRQFVIY